MKIKYIICILTILLILIINSGRISPDNSSMLSAIPTTEQTTRLTTEPTPSSITTAEPIIEATVTDQIKTITEIPIAIETITTYPTQQTPDTLPIDPTPTNYGKEPNWIFFKSDSNDFKIWYPNNKWSVYEITGGDLEYEMNKGYSLCYPTPRKSQYGKLKTIIEDADYVIDIYGYVFLEPNNESLDIVRSYLMGTLKYYNAENIIEYRGTGKINGNNATHFTYILTHVNTKTIGDAYIIQRGYKYYIVAYVGGKIQSFEYDRAEILKILQSFESK